MSEVAINQVLSQMRAMQAMARNETSLPLESSAAAPFSELMSQSIEQVNNSMQKSKSSPPVLRRRSLCLASRSDDKRAKSKHSIFWNDRGETTTDSLQRCHEYAGVRIRSKWRTTQF